MIYERVVEVDERVRVLCDANKCPMDNDESIPSKEGVTGETVQILKVLPSAE